MTNPTNSYNTESRYQMHETNGASKTQRKMACDIAEQNLSGDKLRETKQWINRPKTNVRQLRQLFKRWDIPMPSDWD